MSIRGWDAGPIAPGRFAARLAHFVSGVEATPARMVMLGFVLLIAAGTVLLALPVATSSGRPMSIVDALFPSRRRRASPGSSSRTRGATSPSSVRR
jgi:hypothetical protein